jgi:NitT/TauT family transport system ATP-binding protein
MHTTGTAGGLDIATDAVDVAFGTPDGQLDALASCTVEIEAGSLTAIIGPNGCGKSTLLRVLAGLIQPDRGRVAIGGTSPRVGDGRVGLAFQQPRLVPWRTLLDNVALPLELRGEAPSQRRSRAAAALERVGLASSAGLRPPELSGGMAQRAGLARALIGDPPVLLLDEPFSALDALTRETFDAELERLWLQRRQTVVLVTHSVGEAVAIADRVLVMTPRPGRVARAVEVPLPRPRTPDGAGEPAAAGRAAEIRAALLEGHAAELRPWAAAEGAA